MKYFWNLLNLPVYSMKIKKEVMKKLIFIPIMILMVLPLQAQNEPQVEVGDILTISQPEEGNNFKHLNLPKANFIIKKGGIANYKSIINNRVEVVDIKTDANGDQKVILKREDGRKFFRSFPTISANLEDSMEAGELKI